MLHSSYSLCSLQHTHSTLIIIVYAFVFCRYFTILLLLFWFCKWCKMCGFQFILFLSLLRCYKVNENTQILLQCKAFIISFIILCVLYISTCYNFYCFFKSITKHKLLCTNSKLSIVYCVCEKRLYGKVILILLLLF